VKVEVSTPIVVSGRVRQVMGLFDVPPTERAALSWELPAELVAVDQADWQIGLILGPSGSGKTTIAKALWPDRYLDPRTMKWPADRAVVDAIDAPIKDTTRMLTSVGFGSPPAWLRPFAVLSTGEQFRVELARALLEQDEPVIDEFTSVVDRQVAQYGSATTAKVVRERGRRFVAVTCHFDVMEWLSPDWVYRPDTGVMEWPRGSLQRPAIELEVRGISREAWAVFRPHHYLSGDLHVAARCVGGFIGDECVAFNAYYRFPHPRAKDIMVSSRTVVLPDYQGLGLGGRLTEFVGQMLSTQGYRYRATLAHPALIAHRRHSERWQEITAQNKPSRSKKPKRLVRQHASTRKLITSTFEYVPVE
jgi:GNAT superfamily N-acetyltransferase